MSAEEQPTTAAAEATPAAPAANGNGNNKEEEIEDEAVLRLLQAKEFYTQGSRNYLLKNYAEAADQLSQACEMYTDIYDEFCDEVGMPYLLYAKSLIALGLEENKVIDVPEEDEDDEDDEEDDDEEMAAEDAAAAEEEDKAAKADSAEASSAKSDEKPAKATNGGADSTIAEPKKTDEAVVSSSEDKKSAANGSSNGQSAAVEDAEKPSTSNGTAAVGTDGEQDEDDTTSNLQLAWELLEFAGKIFSRQGESGYLNLAEVKTLLGNIELENGQLDAAIEDYENALKIYASVLDYNNRRLLAELHYQIGLARVMKYESREAVASFKEACALIEAEIEEFKKKEAPTDKDKRTQEDLEITLLDVYAKITEVEETQEQNVAEVRAALDKLIDKPFGNFHNGASSSSTIAATAAAAGASSSSFSMISSSSSSTAAAATTKANDISHLVKRKKPEDSVSSEAEPLASPAKRQAI